MACVPVTDKESRYFVVCTQSLKRYWWTPYLRHNYSHCYLLIWEGACWLYLDPVMNRAHVAILDFYEFQHPAVWLKDPRARVFEAWPKPDAERLRAWWLFGPLTCVEIVKSFLGIGGFWIWTPWQLAQYLRKRKHELTETSVVWGNL
jgi:hypothetical protein